MKRLLTYILFLGAVLGFTVSAGADDRWETLRAINWVENPSNHTRMGRFGELGPYQFRAGTWRMHTKKSFQLATQRATADEVAVEHYEWIKRQLQDAGVDATTYNIAMAWNTGVNNVVKGRVPAVSYDYAQRVTNLVQTFKRSSARATAAKAATASVAPEAAVQPVPVVTPVIGAVHFTTVPAVPDAPRFEVVMAPPPPDPVVYTDREPVVVAAVPHEFVIKTTGAAEGRITALTPQINLLAMGN